MNKVIEIPSGAPIVVAVNGSNGTLAAVRYGAEEADRIGCDLHILHIAPSYLPMNGLVPSADNVGIIEIEAAGREILTASAQPAYEVLPRNRVRATLEWGYPTTGVLESAKSARLLVVGHERTPLLARIAVGQFIGTIAARTPVPVVSVPENWTGPSATAGECRVVLAIKDPQRIPPELLRAGFQSAYDHGAALEIAHVWDVPTGYAALMSSIADDQTRQTAIERLIQRAAGPLLADFPDVEYTASTWCGQPAHILRERSRGADLLLVARRAHGLPFGHFGPTGRALLREVLCPIEVWPIAERSSAPTQPLSDAPVHEPKLETVQ